MSTETYRNVVTLEQHLAFVATRQAARALQESQRGRCAAGLAELSSWSANCRR